MLPTCAAMAAPIWALLAGGVIGVGVPLPPGLLLGSTPLSVSSLTVLLAASVPVAVASAFIYKQIPDVPAVIGMLLIILGVIVINVFSKSSVH